MKMSFRWYGDTDPISLQYISQIPNMRSVVSAVYDVKPGEVWPEESIAKMKKQCEENNLIFDIVESIPVHENIKLGRDNVSSAAANAALFLIISLFPFTMLLLSLIRL